MNIMDNIKKQVIAEGLLHHQCILTGDYRSANKAHKKLMGIYEQIKNDEKLEQLADLLEHENANVKLWAATFLLKRYTDLSVKTINSIITSGGPIATSAKLTLELWNKGMLDLL